jgi:hypothetical protein
MAPSLAGIAQLPGQITLGRLHERSQGEQTGNGDGQRGLSQQHVTPPSLLKKPLASGPRKVARAMPATLKNKNQLKSVV